MAARRINPNAIKLHRTYDVAELAARCGVHKNTVRQWERDGLVPIDDGKPKLFHGTAIRAFLIKRNASRRRPCSAGTLYCFRCREPRPPLPDLLEYVPITPSSGNLRAVCATCETVMHRRVAFTDLAVVMPGFVISTRQHVERLKGSPSTSLNCDFERQAAA